MGTEPRDRARINPELSKSVTKETACSHDEPPDRMNEWERQERKDLVRVIFKILGIPQYLKSLQRFHYFLTRELKKSTPFLLSMETSKKHTGFCFLPISLLGSTERAAEKMMKIWTNSMEKELIFLYWEAGGRLWKGFSKNFSNLELKEQVQESRRRKIYLARF